MVVSSTNVVGGSIIGIVSEFSTTTNNDVNATWTYVFGGGGLATLMDPDNQMVEADNFMFASGGDATNATVELGAASHTWSVLIPTNAATLQWASPTHAFQEAMAFRVVVVPEPSTNILISIMMLALGTWAHRNRRSPRCNP